jgi:hypothetical protein
MQVNCALCLQTTSIQEAVPANPRDARVWRVVTARNARAVRTPAVGRGETAEPNWKCDVPAAHHTGIAASSAVRICKSAALPNISKCSAM